MTYIRIGYIKSPAIRGDLVTVYFNNGHRGSFIAGNDLTSAKVAVMGRMALSEDVAHTQLTVTTRLFKSQQNYDVPGGRWGYLFNIAEYTDTTIPFVNPTWSMDFVDLAFVPEGGGGGFSNNPNFVRFSPGVTRFSDGVAGTLIRQSGISYRQLLLDFPEGTTYGFPNRSSKSIVNGQDGYYLGRPLIQTSFAETEDSREFDVRNFADPALLKHRLYQEGDPYTESYPDSDLNVEIGIGLLRTRSNNGGFGLFSRALREDIKPGYSYRFKETIGTDNRGIEFNVTYEGTASPNTIIWTYITDPSLPAPANFNNYVELESVRLRIRIRTRFKQITQFDAFILEVRPVSGGSFDTTFRYGGTPELYQSFLEAVRESLQNNFLANFNLVASKNNLDGIFSSTQIEDGVLEREFRGDRCIPNSINTEFGIFTGGLDYDAIASNLNAFIESAYFAQLYLIIPTRERVKGKRDIYVQYHDSNPVLLQSIALTEQYDAFISPTNLGLEVVVKTGKKGEFNANGFNLLPDTNAIEFKGSISPGIQTTRNSPPYDPFFRREWGKIDVYLVKEEKIVEHKTFVDGAEIILSPENWQIDWISTYEDYKTPDFPGDLYTEIDRVSSYFEPGTEFAPGDRRYNTLYKSTGVIDGTKSGFRSYFSDRYAPHKVKKNINDPDRTFRDVVISGGSNFIGMGSYLNNSFTYADPLDLLHADDDLSVYVASPTTAVSKFFGSSSKYDLNFPGVNDSIVRGLVEQRQTKSVYYKVIPDLNNSFGFTPTVKIENPTVFPKLNLENLEREDFTLQDVGLDAICFFN